MLTACLQWLPAQRQVRQIILHKGIIQVGLPNKGTLYHCHLVGTPINDLHAPCPTFKHACSYGQEKPEWGLLTIYANWPNFEESLNLGAKTSLSFSTSPSSPLLVLPLESWADSSCDSETSGLPWGLGLEIGNWASQTQQYRAASSPTPNVATWCDF